jgi:hypothetical protein
MIASARRVLFCVGLFGLLLPLPLSAQPQETPALSDSSQVSLITILPGDPVYSFAGHSAVRVHDPARNLDRLYNYGTFSFSDPFFVPKFLYGDLRYYLSVTNYAPMLRFYKRQGRPVIEQPLTLSRKQRSEVFAFLQHNARPEHRYYQYDFFFDNCSTRIRDVLQQTLGSNVSFAGVPSPNRSFRRLLDPYVASRPLMDLGFDLALGLPADRDASREEVMFLPVHLMEAFEKATVTAQDRQRPLVARTDTVRWVDGYDATAPGFDWPYALSLAALVLVVGWTGRQAVYRHRPAGTGDAVLLVLIGCVGVGVAFLWFASSYTVTDANLNLLWAWPTHLFAAYVLLRRPRSPLLRPYLAATAVAAAVFLLGAPLWPQNFHHAVFPLVAAIGLRTGWWALVLYGGRSSALAPAPATQ